jgi:prevent-host-death family protein
MVVNVHEAKTNLSKLLAQVEAGGVVTIARAGHPVARLVPIKRKRFADVFGSMSHLPPLPDDFNDPDPEIEELFGLR